MRKKALVWYSTSFSKYRYSTTLCLHIVWLFNIVGIGAHDFVPKTKHTICKSSVYLSYTTNTHRFAVEITTHQTFHWKIIFSHPVRWLVCFLIENQYHAAIASGEEKGTLRTFIPAILAASYSTLLTRRLSKSIRLMPKLDNSSFLVYVITHKHTNRLKALLQVGRFLGWEGDSK